MGNTRPNRRQLLGVWAGPAPRRSRIALHVMALGLGVVAAAPAFGAPEDRAPRRAAGLPTKSGLTYQRVEVHPATVRLSGRRDYRQLVVTGWVGGEARDLTHQAKYRAGSPRVAALSDGRVTACGADGRTEIRVEAGGRTLRVPVVVEGAARPDPVRFQFETLAVLTKQGCATGSCHGSPRGRGGFSLSLFGYDPTTDRISLTRDGFSRRINVLEPGESLMLKKPLLEVSHGGGRRLNRHGLPHQVLQSWIAEGAGTELSPVHCVRLEVFPGSSRVLRFPQRSQQLSVVAHFSDGVARDITGLATYDTSHPSIAAVDENGRVTGRSRGQAAISVRYLDRLEALHVAVVEDVPRFAWNAPPERNRVDRLVNERLRLLQFTPAATCDDGVFLRRVTLALTGLLPSAVEARAFLTDRAPDKRARCVDRLLETEEFARFWALKKADLLRVSPQHLPGGRAEGLAGWLTGAVRANVPYDRFARELLTAAGDSRLTPAAGYFVAIPTPEERTEMTAQVFLGSRVECARCHNHPFENWTQRDYYRIAAVFARTQTENGVVQPVSRGETQHPTTRETMLPWGIRRPEEDRGDRRIAFATWLTSPENPYFARVEVNRMWAELLGRGIVEPVDDFRSSNPAANPALLEFLAQEFVRSGYDRKLVLRLICNSQTFQRAAQTTPFNETDETLFSHFRVRLLSAEALQDAIALATRTLPTGDALGPAVAALHQEQAQRKAVLASAEAAWTHARTAEVTALPVRLGIWSVAGPYRADSVEAGRQTQLGPERTPGDTLPALSDGKWTARPDWEDGVPAMLSLDGAWITYLARSITSDAARNITVQVQANDAVDVWLNGTVQTGRAGPGGQRTLALRRGENRLLVKVISGTPRATFTFRATREEMHLPAGLNGLLSSVVAALAAPIGSRSPQQRAAIEQAFLAADDRFRRAQELADRLEQRLDYASQRPYPERSTFTAAFGQPRRDTACTCERSTSPTLLQALELLNGGVPYQAAQAGVVHYVKFPDKRLIEELYLSALSRYPTRAERESALRFLMREGERTERVLDLLWTIVNTREFLFQH